jgi:hypothetical protein
MASTIQVKSVTREPGGRILIAFTDKVVIEWPNVATMIQELGTLDDDGEFVRKLFVAWAARRSGGSAATFKTLLEGKALTIDFSKANPFTVTSVT